ncbi:MAG: hypothetical protein WDW36_005377 [Sanguina aurantia]
MDFGGWKSLKVSSTELQLCFTLPTGQSFRWRETGAGEYTGVIGTRVVRMRQHAEDVEYLVVARGVGVGMEGDDIAVRDYFNLGTSLDLLSAEWASKCARYAAVSPFFQGARMLRQDPVECLFSFICSSNNHISRIHGMVERLCSAYGTELHLPQAVSHPSQPPPPPPPPPTHTSAASASSAKPSPSTSHLPLSPSQRHQPAVRSPPPSSSNIPSGLFVRREPTPPSTHTSRDVKVESAEAQERSGEHLEKESYDSVASEVAVKADQSSGPLTYYAFPTLQQLTRATEEELRAAGFGYRAKFITGSVALLSETPGGGEAWLMALRDSPYANAVEALSTLPGIGPKVAACVSLFSLDKHEAIPVDTHVWQIALRYYLPQLEGKSLTKKVHAEVAEAFTGRFGPYAGWAHNTLFISELASQRHRLPEELRAIPSVKPAAKPKNFSAAAAARADSRPSAATTKKAAAAKVKPEPVAGVKKAARTKIKSADVPVARKRSIAAQVDVCVETGVAVSRLLPVATDKGKKRVRSSESGSPVSVTVKREAECGGISGLVDSRLPSWPVVKKERVVVYSKPLVKVEEAEPEWMGGDGRVGM